MRKYIVVIVICCSLLTGFSSVAQRTQDTTTILDDNVVNSTVSQKITYSFSFQEPSLKERSVNGRAFTTIAMPGCLSIGELPGAPLYQVSPVKILIPQGKEITSIDVNGEKRNQIDTFAYGIDLLQKPLLPYQPAVPIGETPSEFIVDSAAYRSTQLVPNRLYRDYSIGYCRGYTLLTLNLCPTTYNPGEGTLFYYPTMTVTIEVGNTEDMNPFYRFGNQNDKGWVESLVINPEIAETYDDSPQDARLRYEGGLCDPSDNNDLGYDYVIITRAALYDFTGTRYNWNDLMNKKEEQGLEATKVKVEDILACSDYWNSDPLFNDTSARIREFCKDAYQDWETQYVLVGGDQDGANKIERRHLDYDAENFCESDLYWSNLDNTFNADHDNQWGEGDDAGFDLYSELFLGSIPCDEGSDVSNWLTKSFYYAESNDPEYLDNAAFYGGDTGWLCQGDDFIDYSAIKGTNNWLGPNPLKYPSWLGFQYGFETWNEKNPGNEYNLSAKWTAEPPNTGWLGGSTTLAINGLKNAINNDQVTLISAIAHADPTMSLDVPMSDWQSQYHNTKPFFITDMGCHCGDMDGADDGVLHSMLFHSDTELAFACVYNTGYGWGSSADTNSSSALQQKLFWDYFFDVTNHSKSTLNWQLGKAHAWSKDNMANTINWTSDGHTGAHWRGVIETCLFFGDPAQLLRSPIPEELPELKITAITGMIGVSAMIVNVGGSTASNIAWKIKFDGRFILLPKNKSIEGIINTLPVGAYEDVRSGFIIGFGRMMINITAESFNHPLVSKTVPAFVIGPIVIIGRS